MDAGYELVAGERRYRAARMAQLEQIPAIVIDAENAKQAELALIENLQREDLNPVEEAEGFKALMDEYHMKQEELAKTVSKSRSYVANALRLLNLPAGVLDMVRAGALSAGHARTLLMFDEPKRLEMAKLALEKGLSVRELENLAKKNPLRDRRDPRRTFIYEIWKDALKKHSVQRCAYETVMCENRWKLLFILEKRWNSSSICS